MSVEHSPAPPPAAPPVPPTPLRRFGGSGNGQRTIEVAAPQEQAYQQLAGTLSALGLDSTDQQPPYRLGGELRRKSWGIAAGKYRGDFTLSPITADRTSVAWSLNLEWGSMLPWLAIGFVMLFVNMAILGMLGLLITIVAVAWTMYDASKYPEAFARQLRERVGSAPSSPWSAPAAAPAHPPAPASPAPAPTSAHSAGDRRAGDGEVLVKIDRLRALREEGILSEEEYARKRAELIDRL